MVIKPQFRMLKAREGYNKDKGLPGNPNIVRTLPLLLGGARDIGCIFLTYILRTYSKYKYIFGGGGEWKIPFNLVVLKNNKILKKEEYWA
jgi:hypothetical protein